MKTHCRSLALAGLALALSASADARTWTSSDGSKTFEGTFISERGEKVTVDVNGRRLTFTKDKLSEADQTWIAENSKPEPPEATGEADLSSQAIGKEVEKKLAKLDGKRVKSYKLTKAPEYYILYFSASW
ncbi:hypothetical protein [Sulfuriroseicoccus oceanibius]|uniref:SLA1 homology domain-containing protein n=1 Tax=Sulfuriroseicoccus oceanibius TaxID=2707525 RepID=A0A6B3LDH8_9BACT|nr:hypothetical protein [Sulfuriroseicoccus oceanibius]QQL44930.1 hypothetical protein G3M56_013850 [Sulfuriroseicoccus oceanibius]